MNNPVEAAKAIRRELKEAYPGVTFRVVTQRFSLGNSVTVYCPENIDRAEVSRRIQKYAYGRFDAMNDSTSVEFDENLPQAKFVSTAKL